MLEVEEIQEKIVSEISDVLESMKATDPSSEDYKDLTERLRDLVELNKKLSNLDPETINAMAKAKEVDLLEKENRKNRVFSVVMTVFKGVGVAAMMWFSHLLTQNEIFDKSDERKISWFVREKD
jgi:hypothetical protein